MTRTSFILAALVAGIAGPGLAQSLDALAAMHFNTGVSAADRQSAVSGSVDPALDALALAKFNQSASFDEFQASPQVASASTGNYGQLIASAGLSARDGSAIGLGDIASAKFVNDHTQTER
jgi:hypothetical protein